MLYRIAIFLTDFSTDKYIYLHGYRVLNIKHILLTPHICGEIHGYLPHHQARPMCLLNEILLTDYNT